MPNIDENRTLVLNKIKVVTAKDMCNRFMNRHIVAGRVICGKYQSRFFDSRDWYFSLIHLPAFIYLFKYAEYQFKK